MGHEYNGHARTGGGTLKNEGRLTRRPSDDTDGLDQASDSTMTLTVVSTSACRCSTTSYSPTLRNAPSPRITSLFSSGRPAAVNASAMSRGPTEPYSLPFGRRVRADGDAGAFELGGAALCVGQDAAGLGFVLGALGFERFHVRSGGRHGLALRNEEVAAVARLDADLVAQVAQVGHFLQKNQIHGGAPLFVSAGMWRAQRVLSEQEKPGIGIGDWGIVKAPIATAPSITRPLSI